ncbi:MAG: hypothetical protein EBS19_10355 [Spirochaetia bacterium]|nr:hypothetical protein [Spirochaetia bacterium]
MSQTTVTDRDTKLGQIIKIHMARKDKALENIDELLELPKPKVTVEGVKQLRLTWPKKIPRFENYSISKLVQQIVPNLPDYNAKSNIMDLSNPSVPQNPADVLNNPLNEKYLNVSNPHPVDLNGKNNTNIVTNTQINQVGPGFLNSIKRVTQLQNLNLNSCFRNNYFQSNPCDFQYILPSEIKNVVSMKLASIEIPNAWYLFSHLQKNNQFVIELYSKNNPKQIFPIVVPDGNYDSESLQHYLNTTYFYESDTETDLKYVKFSIDPYNFKSKFEILPDPFSENSLQFSLLFSEDINQNIMNTLGWMLGFRMPKYMRIKERICSEGLFDAGGDRYIYVSITDYQYNNNTLNIVGFDKSILNEDIIAKIPMVNGKLSLIIDDNNDLVKKRKYNGPVNLSRLHIKIMDKFGTIIDLNNMDFSLTLELEILYESFNFTNVAT